MLILGVVLVLVYLVMGFCALAFISVHLPIQLVGRVVDLSEARMALIAAACLHWLALFSVSVGISWLQSTPGRAQFVDLLIYGGAQVLLSKSLQWLGSENDVVLKPPFTIGRLKMLITSCGLILLVPGLLLLLKILGVKF